MARYYKLSTCSAATGEAPRRLSTCSQSSLVERYARDWAEMNNDHVDEQVLPEDAELEANGAEGDVEGQYFEAADGGIPRVPGIAIGNLSSCTEDKAKEQVCLSPHDLLAHPMSRPEPEPAPETGEDEPTRPPSPNSGRRQWVWPVVGASEGGASPKWGTQGIKGASQTLVGDVPTPLRPSAAARERRAPSTNTRMGTPTVGLRGGTVVATSVTTYTPTSPTTPGRRVVYRAASPLGLPQHSPRVRLGSSARSPPAPSRIVMMPPATVPAVTAVPAAVSGTPVPSGSSVRSVSVVRCVPSPTWAPPLVAGYYVGTPVVASSTVRSVSAVRYVRAPSWTPPVGSGCTSPKLGYSSRSHCTSWAPPMSSRCLSPTVHRVRAAGPPPRAASAMRSGDLSGSVAPPSLTATLARSGGVCDGENEGEGAGASVETMFAFESSPKLEKNIEKDIAMLLARRSTELASALADTGALGGGGSRGASSLVTPATTPATPFRY
mmetsp:Transcript_11565/g.24355  ORF Transcript_11565/g.24355 Transcript_11565/m.24355 type:complete len:493 (+) Transcript_11565:1-1479(+)